MYNKKLILYENNLMNIDLQSYRVFCEVAKYGNISRAAENMYISQSAVTQSIKKLEILLGGNVFYRNKNGVELTEEGKNLYEYIKNSIETMENAENIFSKYINLDKGKIRIGGGNSLINSLIFEPLTEFIKKYPNIEISIGSGITDALMQKLANGELDIVVLNLPYTSNNYFNIEITTLKKSNFAFFASKEFMENNNLKDFSKINEYKLILPKRLSNKRKMLDNYCKEQKIELTSNYEVSSTSVMKKLVLNNVGIGFTNIENLEDIKNQITIVKEVELNGTYEGIACLKKNMCNKATIELVKMIKKYHNIIKK